MIDTNTTINAGGQPEGTYWHFIPENRRLRYGDNRLVVAGETLTAKDASISPCQYGMHASSQAIDALNYAAGPVVSLVRLGNDALNSGDKYVSSERTAIWIYDASRLLREFACDVAETVLLNERKAGREPDARNFAVISIMRRFIRGEASESEWAEADAYASSRTAEWAAIAAVKSFTSASAYTAGVTAYASVDSSVAYAVVESFAARNAAKGMSNDRLTRMLLAAMNDGQGEFEPNNARG